MLKKPDIEYLKLLPLPLFIKDSKHQILYVNDALCELLNLKEQEILGRRCHEVIHRMDCIHEKCPENREPDLRGVRASEFFETNLEKSIRAELFPLEDGLTLHTVTELQNGWSLKPDGRAMKKLVRAIAVPHIILDREFKVKEVSEDAQRLMEGKITPGMDPTSLRCKTVLLPEEAKRQIQKGRVYQDVVEFRGPDGRSCYIKRAIVPLIDEEGLYETLIVLNDLNRVRETETRLTQTRDFLRSIFEGIGDALVVVDPDFRIISANRGYLNQTALKEEDIGRVYCYQVSHRYSQPCFREGEDCPVYKTLLEGTPQRAVHEHFGADGELIYVEIVSYPLRDTEGKIYAVVETLRDITEMKRLERESLELKSQLMQAQKMEAIGTLAAGIAHDFNNMLLGINGFAEMLMNRLSDPDLKDKAERILDIVDRASRLTEQILIIGRKVKYNKKPLQLNRFISHSLETLRRMIEENIELKVKLEKDLPLIEVDEAQLYQVLLNLIVNARDELRQKGGEIVIRTGKRSVSDSLGLRQGEYVFFSVKDNGGGIAENIKDRIFEPFFSTKPKGEGTGLGLSVVYSIVKDHGGFIDLSSKPGRGAEFTVFFPATKEAEERPEREGETEKQEISGHGRRVLVAEDEEVIRDFLSACLSEWGFEVVVASSGDEAMALFQQSPEDFDLVLLDKVMPGLSGTEAFRMMKKQNPSLRAIICTGYASAEVLSDTSREGAFVLKKPFRMQDLKRAIGEVFSS